MKHLIVICEYGWILCGVLNTEVTDPSVTALKEAAVVRSWRGGKGIGGLAKEDNKNLYTLDPVGNVNINDAKVLFVIPCEW